MEGESNEKARRRQSNYYSRSNKGLGNKTMNPNLPGMEDNIYYRKDELLKNNADFVARAARIARELNKEPTTPDVARKILELKFS